MFCFRLKVRFLVWSAVTITKVSDTCNSIILSETWGTYKSTFSIHHFIQGCSLGLPGSVLLTTKIYLLTLSNLPILKSAKRCEWRSHWLNNEELDGVSYGDGQWLHVLTPLLLNRINTLATVFHCSISQVVLKWVSICKGVVSKRGRSAENSGYKRQLALLHRLLWWC
jgi:hypothetical protein